MSSRIEFCTVILAALCMTSLPPLSAQTSVYYVAGSSAKICQLTGLAGPDGKPKHGVTGTDFGAPIEHRNPGDFVDTLYLVFGDTTGPESHPAKTALQPSAEEWFDKPPGMPASNLTINMDAIGHTTAATALELCNDFRFLSYALPNGDQTFAPPQVNPLSGATPIGHGTFKTPNSGFSWAGRLYLFFARTGLNPQTNVVERRSILTSSDDPTRITNGNLEFRYEFEVSHDKFLNIAPVRIKASDFLPQELPPNATADGLLLFGAGEYRKSPPYLAFAPLSANGVPDPTQWHYWGIAGSETPGWVSNADLSMDSKAISIFPPNYQGCIGEFSVSWNQYLRKWLMLYNCAESPRGIRFHVSDKPWGPWSDVVPYDKDAGGHDIQKIAKDAVLAPSLIFEPTRDKGYGFFMHRVGRDARSCSAKFDPYNVQPDPLCDDGDSGTLDFCAEFEDENKIKKLACHHSSDNLYDSVFLKFDGTSLKSTGARINEIGGEYAPFLIPRLTTGDFRSTTIYYMLSTWNPYQVFLMKSTLRIERPPLADAGADQTAPVGTDCTAQLRLDGSGSSDPDGDSLQYTWTGPFPTVTSSTPTATVQVPLGTYTITLKVEDGLGGESTDTVVITTLDTTPPTVTSQLARTMLWRPDHSLLNVGLAASAVDNCDGVRPVAVTTYADEDDEEPTGDGTFSPDAKGLSPGSLRLRAERRGTADGRVYLVRAMASDNAGNTSWSCTAATVPKDLTPSSLAAVSGQATQAQAYCAATTGQPPGYFISGDGPNIGPIQ